MTDDVLSSIEAVFRRVDREVWIVTAADGPRRGGLVATWVQQASIDPERPTVAVAIAENHFTRELIDGGGAFGLHLVREDQLDVVWRFAIGSGRDRDKLAGIAWREGQTRSPMLDDCVARLEARVFDRHDGGDRVYFWADVVVGEVCGNGAPLTEAALFARADDEQKAALRDGLQADLAVQRPLVDAWRRQRGASG